MGDIERVAPQSRVWVTEFTAEFSVAPAPIASLPALKKHPPVDLGDGLPHRVDLSPTANYIRMVSEVQFAFSTTGDAGAGDILVPRLHVEYFLVREATFISFIGSP